MTRRGWLLALVAFPQVKVTYDLREDRRENYRWRYLFGPLRPWP